MPADWRMPPLPVMNALDSHLPIALEAAVGRVKATVVAVAERVATSLGSQTQSTSPSRIGDRDLVLTTQIELRRKINTFHLSFGETLRDRILRDTAPRAEARRRTAAADWQSMTLVEDHEVEERMLSERIGQQISHVCEPELRELAAYMGSVMGHGSAEEERNPLRAENLGTAVYHAIEATTVDHEGRKLLAREFGVAMAQAMPDCYRAVIVELQSRHVQPVSLSLKHVEGPGNQIGGHSGYESVHGDLNASRNSGLNSMGPGSVQGGGDGFASRHGTSYGTAHGTTQRGRMGSSTSRASLGGAASERDWNSHGRNGAGEAGSSRIGRGEADAELMSLLRRLTFLASRPGRLDVAGGSGFAPSMHRGVGGTGGGTGGGGGGGQGAGGTGHAGLDAALGSNDLGLVAVNLIRAHREELRQASSGKLDHMVIDVVGSLFDQILSDARVPPQMARQIARLQLPVLRVALADATFFSSRRHPVRRFVNRIASLALAYEDFDDGPGKHLLERVRALVQEIVEGDFDQLDIYSEKLDELEIFIGTETEREASRNGSASLLESKESELRIQQRYMQKLRAAIDGISMPPYLRDFVVQVWSQALVVAIHREGADSELAKRYRNVARDLIMSVQPKGSPMLRKRFLMQLPSLMKDMNEGMKLIGWPAEAQKEFFGKLLPAHAESLKAPPMSELDHNLLAKRLEAIVAAPIPGAEEFSHAEPVLIEEAAVEQHFTPAEARQVGLVDESAVDWSASVDIEIGVEADAATAVDIDLAAPPTHATHATHPTASTAHADRSAFPDLSLPSPNVIGIDINLDLVSADPAEPSRGAQLIDHVKIGFAYQMLLRDEWQKVRLSYVSPGRSFFVFSHGKKHAETISLTSRMLARMCEANRLRAVESAYLMERATARARRQLAAMNSPA